MRRATVWAIVALVLGCKREADARQPSLVTQAPPQTVAATDASRAPEPTIRTMHVTCGLGYMDSDAGIRTVGTDAEVPEAARARRYTSCELPDGGVAWTIAPEPDRRRRNMLIAARAFAVESRRDPDRVRREVAAMEREAASTDRWILPGLLFRAPERSTGRLVRIEGAALDVREEGGETFLAIALDVLGRERIEVTYPGIASDRLVNGADVVVYGFSDGSHVQPSRAGDRVVPEVLALHIDVPEAASAQTQTDRLLRRVRRHRY